MSIFLAVKNLEKSSLCDLCVIPARQPNGESFGQASFYFVVNGFMFNHKARPDEVRSDGETKYYTKGHKGFSLSHQSTILLSNNSFQKICFLKFFRPSLYNKCLYLFRINFHLSFCIYRRDRYNNFFCFFCRIQ